MPKKSGKGIEVLQLRAHHICCLPSARWVFTDRGAGYERVRNEIRSALSRPESVIMVIEGVDTLCHECPQCVNERCSSPKGNEDEVRKWDAILLRELGLTFGTCLTAGEWRQLLKQKTPFKLCQRCSYRQECDIGGKVA